ncbi:hypothetical protein LLEC1_06734 [Akanthomyces lecanii]|uniref:F-box domain-containing protein n=1 Tax=Cordyceps confragosa TaxID=2714763 RepID=A0A179ID77_CORDF|nr:hypothetical protein LLEC1_06734 [Akanthomyces lecanii]
MSAASLDYRTKRLTYLRPERGDHALDEKLPNLAPSAGCVPLRPPKSHLGTLKMLPLELLGEVLSWLDVLSLTEFRRVNRCTVQLTSSIRQYRAIHEHARTALSCILKIKTGRYMTCSDIYEKLCSSECEECGDFAGYLYLLTCKRVCLPCFTEKDEYLPLSFDQAQRQFGVSVLDRIDLPKMIAVAGTYSPHEHEIAQRIALLDHEAALQTGVSLYGALSVMRRHAREMQILQDYGETDCKSRDARRFVATLPLHCRRKFTAASFLEHLRTSGSIKRVVNLHRHIDDGENSRPNDDIKVAERPTNATTAMRLFLLCEGRR